jgi:hypothetical protein
MLSFAVDRQHRTRLPLSFLRALELYALNHLSNCRDESARDEGCNDHGHPVTMEQ